MVFSLVNKLCFPKSKTKRQGGCTRGEADAGISSSPLI